MKTSNLTTSLVVATTLLLSGCGSDESAQENVKSETPLSAQSIRVVDTSKNYYYGFCQHKNNTIKPIRLGVSDPISDAAVSIATLVTQDRAEYTTLPNSAGYINYVELNAGDFLNPNIEWDFSLSEDKTFYFGTQNKGSISECTLLLGLNVKTVEGLVAIFNEHRDEMINK
jgi:hypothetical protein